MTLDAELPRPLINLHLLGHARSFFETLSIIIWGKADGKSYAVPYAGYSNSFGGENRANDRRYRPLVFCAQPHLQRPLRSEHGCVQMSFTTLCWCTAPFC